MTLGERIAQARKQVGLSQEQLGEKLGVSRQAISKWESGQNNPDVAYVAELCRLFGVSSDWLLLGMEDAQEKSPVRCPNCNNIVTGLDNFCPSCGRPLKSKSSTYTLMVNCKEYAPSLVADQIMTLKNFSLLPENSPIHKKQTLEEISHLLEENPCLILAHGLTKVQVERIIDKLFFPVKNSFHFLLDSSVCDEVLKDIDPIPTEQLQKQSEPLSFSGAVLAVIVGFIIAVFLLALL